MELENHIQELESEYKYLQSHIALTGEHWRDSLKERFYNENLSQIPSEYNAFNSELQNLNQSFASVENIINSLE